MYCAHTWWSTKVWGWRPKSPSRTPAFHRSSSTQSAKLCTLVWRHALHRDCGTQLACKPQARQLSAAPRSSVLWTCWLGQQEGGMLEVIHPSQKRHCANSAGHLPRACTWARCYRLQRRHTIVWYKTEMLCKELCVPIAKFVYFLIFQYLHLVILPLASCKPEAAARSPSFSSCFKWFVPLWNRLSLKNSQDLAPAALQCFPM